MVLYSKSFRSFITTSFQIGTGTFPVFYINTLLTFILNNHHYGLTIGGWQKLIVSKNTRVFIFILFRFAVLEVAS